jgi:hypothetical protein
MKLSNFPLALRHYFKLDCEETLYFILTLVSSSGSYPVLVFDVKTGRNTRRDQTHDKWIERQTP